VQLCNLMRNFCNVTDASVQRSWCIRTTYLGTCRPGDYLVKGALVPATPLVPIDESDPELDQRIMSLRSAGLTTGQIARQLMVPVHEVHRRIDTILSVIDANYRRRAIAESLVTIDTVIATHLKTVSDPDSASVVIRGVCERRALLGVTGSTDPVQLSRQSRPEETSTSSVRRGLALIERMRRLAKDGSDQLSGAVNVLSDTDIDNSSN
jgi:hypothetical protein